MIVNKMLSGDSMELLGSMIGKELEYFCCDPFTFNHMVYRNVSLFIGGEVYMIQNIAEAQAYFGTAEDICNLRIVRATESDARSALADTKQNLIPFHAPITRITVISESQYMYHDEQLMDEYRFVRGFLFTLSDGREISFEKTDDFSEQIAIQRGRDLINQISAVSECDDLEPGFRMEITRMIQNIE